MASEDVPGCECKYWQFRRGMQIDTELQREQNGAESLTKISVDVDRHAMLRRVHVAGGRAGDEVVRERVQK